MRPDDGRKSPAASDKRVVFPQPEGPMMATNSPSPTEKVRSFAATSSPRAVW